MTLRMHAGLVEAAAVVRHILVRVAERPFEPLELQRGDLVAGRDLDGVERLAWWRAIGAPVRQRRI